MKIIFFLPVIIRDAHMRIFPLERLEKEGHTVIILDATEYFGVYKRTATEPLLLKHTIECKTRENFISFKNDFSREPVLYVTNSSYLRLAKDVLSILVRKQDKLLSATTRTFAGLHTYHKGVRKFIENFIRSSDHILPWYSLRIYYKYFRGNYIPDYFLGSTEFLLPLKAYLTVKRKNRFLVHSDDVNQVYEPLEGYIDPQKRIGVFMDQMIPYINRRNPGTIPESMEENYKNDYYSNLRRCLNQLKKQFDLDEIVIALHPEAKTLREEIDKKYQGFRTFENVAHELIRDSFVVFGHFSTVIGFAIFYKKPVILINDHLINSTFKKGINSFIQEIDAQVVNMDQPEDLDKTSLNFNQRAYFNYTRKFMKDNEIKDNSFYYAIKEIEKRIIRN